MKAWLRASGWAVGVVCAPLPAWAAGAGLIDGAALHPLWALPFIGILLSIALFPLLAPHAWERHQPKIAAFWGLALLLPLCLAAGAQTALGALAHTALLDYLPFLLLLLALFTTAGGILVVGNIHGSPGANTVLLALGALLASLIGTTGASMVMIRPVLRANDNRRHNVHVFVFFIFLVSNVGGALTPLGDPPLFLGFLRGVDFFWTTRHLAAETAFVGGVLLVLFFLLDTLIYRNETVLPDPTPDRRVRVRGLANLALIAIVVAAILLSATWKPGIVLRVAGAEVGLQNLVRDGIFVLVTLASLAVTPREDREANGFSWGPIKEVAVLFAAIFVTMIPVLAMLRAGPAGPFAPLVALVTHPDGTPNHAAYFWLAGALSSFLDNAPTYLVFFELAGADPVHLMTEGALTLAAMSCGAVFMGANSYIGNAPNFMVYAIARSGGVRMPSFFGYMLWSGAILLPTFVVTTFLFFR